jgi:hypothetical protein
VTATVSTAQAFLPEYKDDFVIYEDNQPVESRFSPSARRSASDRARHQRRMRGRGGRARRDRPVPAAAHRPEEFFLYRFSASPDLVADWTNDRDRLAVSVGRIHPNGGTAMYDAVAEAVPMAQSGQNRKKAVVIISDGNDTSSRVGVGEVRRWCESEVLVYAVGIDGGTPTIMSGHARRQWRASLILPHQPGRGGGSYPPFPGGGGGGYSGARRPCERPRSARSPTTAAAVRRSCRTRATWIPPRPPSRTS